jgi:O-antigen biosynthesis protein WbqP
MSKSYYNNKSKRVFDLIFLLITLPVTLLIISLILLIYLLSNNQKIIHKSKRVGINNKIFLMYKFRTMKTRTPQVATHLLKKPDQYITSIGYWLRRSSLDEAPQIINVLKGDMSMIGPRPALYNQHNLIKLRNKFKIQRIYPGITGWAQINGRDNLSISHKVKLDNYYKRNKSLYLDLKILFFTIINVIFSKGLRH